MTRTEWNSTNLIREWIECISNERDLERISFGAGALSLPQNGKPSQHFHNNIIVNTETSLKWWYCKETDCKSSWRWDDGLGALSRWAAALSQDPKRPKMSLHAAHDCDEEAVCCQYSDHGEDGHGDERLVPP